MRAPRRLGEGGREGGRPLSRCFREKNEKPTLDRGRGRAVADGPRRRWRRGEWNKLSFRRDLRRVYTSSPILILSILPRSLDRTSIQSTEDLLASPPSPLLSLHSNPTPPLCRPSSIRGYTHSPDKRVRHRSKRASSFHLGRPRPWSPLSAKRRSRSRVRGSGPALI